MSPQMLAERSKLLNHVELLYRPGERHLVGKAFEALGCDVLDIPGQRYLIIRVDKEKPDNRDNVVYASEVSPEQWQFEQLLQERLGKKDPLAKAFDAYSHLLKRHPQNATHFGIRFGSVGLWEETIERVKAIKSPPLAGRLFINAVIRPGSPGSISESICQAFVKTDIFAASFLCLGQHIELQCEVAPIKL